MCPTVVATSVHYILGYGSSEHGVSITLTVVSPFFSLDEEQHSYQTVIWEDSKEGMAAWDVSVVQRAATEVTLQLWSHILHIGAKEHGWQSTDNGDVAATEITSLGVIVSVVYQQPYVKDRL